MSQLGNQNVLQYNNRQYLSDDVEQMQEVGNEEAAMFLQKLADEGSALTYKVMEYLPGANGRHAEARVHTLKRGVLTFLIMILLCAIGASMNMALGVTLVFLTIAIVLAFAYAYDVATSEQLFNRGLLTILILMSFALALLATIGIFV